MLFAFLALLPFLGSNILSQPPSVEEIQPLIEDSLTLERIKPKQTGPAWLGLTRSHERLSVKITEVHIGRRTLLAGACWPVLIKWEATYRVRVRELNFSLRGKADAREEVVRSQEEGACIVERAMDGRWKLK